ncbi:MAG TPA: transketolase [Candidatus Avacidaminococcus intestinavium]|uniref:Transketolase n=1 Tax=Candidatus Avacidaminococcus intestinavium TaxID=2840684 RepID=A0A9D1SLE7_9FIRM|nr:transketolase [Candidatus Avacidaminococcus intestinavium]
MKTIDRTAISTLRFLSVDAVEKAKSGHPGFPLGVAPLMYTLWDKFISYNPKDPAWFNRDRFVLSSGHGSALLYSMLHLAGFDLSLADLKEFRQWESKTAGHPEYGMTPGVEASTGPIGHGFAMAVGMAIAEEMLAAQYNRDGFKIIDHYTYGICSDGDLMEGVASEAASLAGTLALGKLIMLYDDNKITIEGNTEIAFREDVGARFAAYGWQVLRVDNAEEIDVIVEKIAEGQAETNKPTLVIVRTHIGWGSPKQDSAAAHGEPLGSDALAKTKEQAGWPLDQTFFVPEEVHTYFEAKHELCAQKQAVSEELLAAYTKCYPKEAAELSARLQGDVALDLDSLLETFAKTAKTSTREASGEVLQKLAALLPGLVGGSADLGPSNKTDIKGASCFSAENRNARLLHFGVREHAMGKILNGIALHGGFIPYGGTFLVFSDFMRPALRMAALMGIRSIFVFTHDSIALGEDGPTHQPIEQTMSLRLIPELCVMRPADALETAAAWQIACLNKHKPTALLLSRQKLPVLNDKVAVVAKGVARGAYLLSPAATDATCVLLAAGSEVHLALAAQEELAQEGIGVNVVSMPAWDLFEQQAPEYKEQLLPSNLPKLAIEAGVTLGWSRYTGTEANVIGINKFGASAPGDVVYEKYGFTVEHVIKRVKELL